jgi:two-component system chemotaxis sensor kinase CheA
MLDKTNDTHKRLKGENMNDQYVYRGVKSGGTIEKVSFKSKKYRAILISVSLFILLDASVLSANFWLSYQIEKDATAVNIAGRQRMLSQRISKSIYDFKLFQTNPVETENTANYEREIRINELKSAVSLFHSTINNLKNGGEVIGTDGQPVLIQAMTTPKTINSVDTGLLLWTPYKELLDNFFANFDGGNSNIYDQNLENYTRENNVELLRVMNELTTELAVIAQSKANLLRQIQIFGILLAFINFLIVTFHFVKKLTESDKEIAAAQQETEQILETVDEGLFLLDKDLNIADKHSDKLLDIFGKDEVKNEQLPTLLSQMVSTKDQRNTEEYVGLLFDKRKKARLLGDLNPLKEVLVQIHDKTKGTLKKYLSFGFKRVEENGEVTRVLTSVSDITKEVELREELKRLEKESDEQVDILSLVLSSDADMLGNFLNNASHAYSEINGLLKQENKTTADYKRMCDKAMASMHKIKGESTALSIDELSSLAHKFEKDLKEIKEKTDIYGQDFVPMTVTLERMMRFTENLDGLHDKIHRQSNSESVKEKPFKNIHQQWKHLYDLTRTIAERQDKSAEFIASGFNDFELSNELRDFINTLCTQLIRNSVSHGIEKAEERVSMGKSETGLIKTTLIKFANNDIKVEFSDDGRGLDSNIIGEKAIDAGIISREELNTMDFRQIINLLFHSGFSTASDEEANEDFGHGIGLSLIKQKTSELGGKISINSRNSQGTKFSFYIPAGKKAS